MDNIFRFIDFDFKHRWAPILGEIILLSVLGIILLQIGEFFRTSMSIFFIIHSPEAIRIAFFFLWIMFLFGLLKVVFKRYQDSRLIKDGTYNFKCSHWPNKWIFNGKTETTTQIDELFVQSSRAGCLLKTHVWRNCRMTFEMKFVEHLEKNIGIVFRAEDLDNYLMLEVFRKDGGSSDGKRFWKSGIKPHIRYKGGWEIFGQETHYEHDFSDFVQIVLEARDDVVKLFYDRKQIFTWILPTHVDVNHIEAGFKQEERTGKVDLIGKDIARSVQELPFRLAYGMVGFRAHPGQAAIIRDLKVESL